MNANDFLAAIAPKARPPLPSPALPAGRRRKIWDIPGRRHCALIGTCLPTTVMKKLAQRAGIDIAGLADYDLHSRVVSHCNNRNPLSDSIQRFFDKRFAASIARFAKLRDSDSIAGLWLEARSTGSDIAGALWAAWTHPRLDETTGNRIFGDIHMLSHQFGAEARSELALLEHWRTDNVRLRSENAALRKCLAEQDRKHKLSVHRLAGELETQQRHNRLLERQMAEQADDAGNRHQAATLRRRAEALASRAETLEDRNAMQARRIAALDRDLGELKAELAVAESALTTMLGVCHGAADAPDRAGSCPRDPALNGRCVLCIGGRSGLVDGYRRIVETRGGHFVHHDGGREDNLHRLDAALATADAVVCQSACVSHAAYWRLKAVCKRLGKPCVFVRSPGVVSFARSLEALAAGGVSLPRLTTPANSPAQ